MKSNPESPLLLILIGDTAATVTPKVFPNQPIYIAPFGTDALSSDPRLGDEELLIFAIKEALDCDAAGVLVDSWDKTILAQLLRLDLRIKAVKVPISPELLNISEVLYSERTQRWEFEDAVERMQHLMRGLNNTPTNSPEMGLLVSRYQLSGVALSKMHNELIAGLHARIRDLLLTPADVFEFD